MSMNLFSISFPTMHRFWLLSNLVTLFANPIPQTLNDIKVYADCGLGTTQNRLSDENSDDPTVNLFRRTTYSCPSNQSPPSASPVYEESRTHRPSVNYCNNSFFKFHVSCGAEVIGKPSSPEYFELKYGFFVVLNCLPGKSSGCKLGLGLIE